MIVMTLLTLCTTMITTLFSGLELLSLPYEAMMVLVDIFCYGTWVIGIDLMGIILAVITGTLGTKLFIGIVLFVWRLLPLT